MNHYSLFTISFQKIKNKTNHHSKSLQNKHASRGQFIPFPFDSPGCVWVHREQKLPRSPTCVSLCYETLSTSWKSPDVMIWLSIWVMMLQALSCIARTIPLPSHWSIKKFENLFCLVFIKTHSGLTAHFSWSQVSF